MSRLSDGTGSRRMWVVDWTEGVANMRRAGGPSKMVASTSRRSLLLRVTPIKLTVPCLGPCDRWPRGK